MTALAAGRRPKVTVSIEGHSFRSSIATVSGRSMVGVSAAVREATGLAGGNVVDVDIELDLQPREVELPPELEAAFEAEPRLRDRLGSLSYSAQRRLVEPISAAKAADTRQRRAEKVLSELRVVARD